MDDPLHAARLRLQALAVATMPFGRHKGERLVDVPVAYLLWFRDRGWPSGELGSMMAEVLELKVQGLAGLVRRVGA